MTDKVSGILHVRPINITEGAYSNYGGISLAYSVKESGDVKVSLAICSHQDRFNRKRGRQIALGRLNSERAQELVSTFDSSALEFMAAEYFGVKMKIEPKVGSTGEFYVEREKFPLSAVLLLMVRPMVLDLLHREAADHAVQFLEEYTIEDVAIVSYRNGLGWHFGAKTNEVGIGVRVV